MPDTSEFQKIRILLTDFNESLPYKIAWKSIQWGLNCYMQMMDGSDKTISCFLQLSEHAYKN